MDDSSKLADSQPRSVWSESGRLTGAILPPWNELSEFQQCVHKLVGINEQGLRFSTANFANFHGTICEIPLRYYAQIPYILWPVGVVVSTDNTSK